MRPWLALRLSTGLSQREVERRLGWTKRGHLSLIERGLTPTPDQARELRRFYAERIA
jgi:transcriptional regulator with XRE-family HTH domain